MEQKAKRRKWTYEANWDYILPLNEHWRLGLLNDDGNPYECPTVKRKALIAKIKEIDQRQPCRVRVTVEIDVEPDIFSKQHPELIDVVVIR